MSYVSESKLQSFANKFAAKIDSLFVRKITGKGLSTNDYTDVDKDKLDDIEENAQVNVIDTISLNGVNIPVTGKNVNIVAVVASDLADYYTSAQVDQKLSAIPKFDISVVQSLPTTGISDTTVYLVPSQDPDSQNIYTEYIYVDSAWEILGSQAINLSDATQTTSGLMSAADKTKLDGLEEATEADIDAIIAGTFVSGS